MRIDFLIRQNSFNLQRKELPDTYKGHEWPSLFCIQ